MVVVQIQGFKQYVEEYVSGHVDGNGDPLKIVYENVNDRWEVAVALSDEGFRNVSFVNSIATTKVLFDFCGELMQESMMF